jgi:hypothetical protein
MVPLAGICDPGQKAVHEEQVVLPRAGGRSPEPQDVMVQSKPSGFSLHPWERFSGVLLL